MARPRRSTTASGPYRLDELGWLQFQRLCDLLLEAHCGVRPERFSGEADRCRSQVALRPVCSSPESQPLPEPTLVAVMWSPPGPGSDRIEWSSQADHRRKVIYAAARDVTERRLAEQAVRTAEERFRIGFEHSPIGMAVVAADGEQTHEIVSVNQALPDLTGYSSLELIGMRTLTQLSHPDDLPEIREGLRALLSGEIDVYQREFRLRHAEGHYVWASLTTSLVRDDDGRPLYRLSQVQDIDGRKRAEDKLRYLADHDALTGVVNRRRFELELAEQIGQSNADGQLGALLVIDLDGFKQINDSLGNAAGDDVLSRVGRALSDRLRGGDVIGRLGGDEFGVLLRRTTLREAELVAGDLRAVVADEFAADLDGRARAGDLTMSVGIAAFGRKGDPADSAALLRTADLAMYEAKTSGGDQAAAADSASLEPDAPRAANLT